MKLGIISSPNLQDSIMTRLDLMKNTANPKVFGGGGGDSKPVWSSLSFSCLLFHPDF
jgi:hypothetical protein